MDITKHVKPEVSAVFDVNAPGLKVALPGLGEVDFRLISLAKANELAKLDRTSKYFTAKATKPVKESGTAAGDK